MYVRPKILVHALELTDSPQDFAANTRGTIAQMVLGSSALAKAVEAAQKEREKCAAEEAARCKKNDEAEPWEEVGRQKHLEKL